MIVFATPVSEPDAYRRYAEPGIRRVAEPDSPVLAFAAVGSFARSANLLLDAAAGHEDLEAVVLVHPHCEISDPDFTAKVRAALTDDVDVLGAVGASGFTSIAWWEGDVRMAPTRHRYTDYGGGEIDAWAWTEPSGPGEVDAVEGMLMVLSPWAARNVRFDERLWMSDGVDVDFCRQVREQGRRVVVADLRTVQHRSLDIVEERARFAAAHVAFAEKWGDDETDWTTRARRAEAEREAAHAIGYFRLVEADERVAALEAELAAATSSRGWRATVPLRRLNSWRRGR